MPTPTDPTQVTQLLQAMVAGDPAAPALLLPLVHAELHRLASSYMRRERIDHTLQPTALIHEAYVRLALGDQQNNHFNSRAHFIAMAANVMRHVLVDYARAHKAEQRGGDLQRVEFENDLAITPDKLVQVAMIDQALTRLELENPRQARVVELRYFGGLSIEQIATHLGIAPRSVKRDWSLARIWLFRTLQPGQPMPKESPEKD